MIDFYIYDNTGQITLAGTVQEDHLADAVSPTDGTTVKGKAHPLANYVDGQGNVQAYTGPQQAARISPPGPHMRWNPQLMTWVSTLPPAPSPTPAPPAPSPTPPVSTPAPQGAH